MESPLFWLLSLPLIALFAHSPIEKALAKLADGRFLEAWHVLFRCMWGLLGWCMLTALTGAALNKLFPDQSVYIFSGSWITALPAFLWGVLISWVILGRRQAVEGEPPIATVDGRIHAIMNGAGSVLKYGGCAVLVIAGTIASFLISPWINERISKIPPSEAILFGAIIIAWAIFANKRK